MCLFSPFAITWSCFLLPRLTAVSIRTCKVTSQSLHPPFPSAPCGGTHLENILPECGALLDKRAAARRRLVGARLEHEAAAGVGHAAVSLGGRLTGSLAAQRRRGLVVRLALGGAGGAERGRGAHAVAVPEAALPLALVRA